MKTRWVGTGICIVHLIAMYVAYTGSYTFEINGMLFSSMGLLMSSVDFLFAFMLMNLLLPLSEIINKYILKNG